ncbi:RNase adaptor protein RapZ, partial [Escherichia coli]|nr:RNase adaptor protein RapZ [Escherichia coli]
MATAQRLVLITGPAGAGRSTALHALEDLGYEAIDNLPLSLIPRLFDGPPHGAALALGVDPRTRDFSAGALADLVGQLRADPRVQSEVLYLDCRPETLQRRFSETRRRHPLAPAESPDAGIARELDLLSPIRQLSDFLIDTSDLTQHDLRAELARLFSIEDGHRLALSVQSFSYKRGIPRAADMVFDCRFLRNPYWQPDLRGLNGLSPAVRDYVCADPRFDGFFDRVRDMIE